MTESKTAKLPEGLGELDKPLTDGDRIALASTALAILRLPPSICWTFSQASRAGAPVTSSAKPTTSSTPIPALGRTAISKLIGGRARKPAQRSKSSSRTLLRSVAN
jgi:hypothetical protein